MNKFVLTYCTVYKGPDIQVGKYKGPDIQVGKYKGPDVHSWASLLLKVTSVKR